MKPKKYSEVNYTAMNNTTLSEIKRDFKIMTILMYIVILISLVLSIKVISLTVENEVLKQEKQEQEELIHIQDKLIGE